jgi:PKD repeat protein
MTINGQSGLLGGNPTAAGTFTAQLVASNSAGSSNPLTLTLLISPAANTPVIVSSQTATGQLSTAFSYQITATLSPTAYVATGLPAGLSINSTTGLISGTPTTSGTFPVTLTAVNANGSGKPVTLTITIAPNLTFGP